MVFSLYHWLRVTQLDISAVNIFIHKTLTQWKSLYPKENSTPTAQSKLYFQGNHTTNMIPFERGNWGYCKCFLYLYNSIDCISCIVLQKLLVVTRRPRGIRSIVVCLSVKLRSPSPNRCWRLRPTLRRPWQQQRRRSHPLRRWVLS